MKQAVMYVRVSSKEQQQEGFSIPAQKQLLSSYSSAEGIGILRVFEDAETAKEAGRSSFNEMLAFLRRHRSCRALLVEKTDRLYRNIKDWVTIDELDLEIHFVKEGRVLTKDARSADKFMHGIKVLMAKNFCDNLSEESSKGMREKARQGLYPSCAPVGYLNNRETRTIHPDPHRAAEVRRLFEQYAERRPSFAELAGFADRIGLRSRRGARLSPELIRKLLQNPIYVGVIRWNGEQFPGKHEPLVSRALFDEVQSKLGGAHRPRRRKHHFAFRGLLHCGRCGCVVTPERKKGRYVYYHCTHTGQPCGEGSIREEDLAAQLGGFLRPFRLAPERLEWLQTALRESHAEQRAFREGALRKVHSELEATDRKQAVLYEDKLAGVIGADFWKRRHADLEAERSRLQAQVDTMSAATGEYYEDGLRLLELTQRAHELYVSATLDEKRRLCDFVYQNCNLAGGLVTIEYRKPFDLFVDAVAAEGKLARKSRPFAAGHPVWYPRRDSNPRPPD